MFVEGALTKFLKDVLKNFLDGTLTKFNESALKKFRVLYGSFLVMH